MASRESAEKHKQRGSAKIIIIAVVVVIAIAASAVATWFFLSGDDKEVVETEPSTPVKGPAIYYKFKKPIIVTFDVGSRQRFMQVNIALMMRQKAVYDGVVLHLPVIQSRLLTLFGQQDFMEIQTHEGRLAMQEAAKESVNTVMAQQSVNGEVENVLFTNLVLQ